MNRLSGLRARPVALVAATVVAFSTAAGVIPQTMALAAGSIENVDDSDSTITYAGDWLNVNPGGCFNATCHNARATGATATYTFKGAKIIWRGIKGSDQGSATVSIDGGAPTTVTLTAPTRSVDVPVYTSPTLPLTSAQANHTIKITTLSAAWVTLDRFEVVPVDATVIDDGDPSATYTGGFSSYNPGGCWAGTCHNAATTGATATVPFTGTQMTWYSITGSDQGSADVYIDGVLDTTVNLYAATRSTMKAVYTKSGLAAGSHTFKIVTKNTKWVTFDVLQVDVPITGGGDPVTGTVQIPSGYLTVGLDSAGTVVDMVDNRTGTDRIAPGKAASLVSLVVNGQQQRPTSVTRSGDLLTFTNTSGMAVDVRLVSKTGYTTFEVTRAVAAAGADLQTVLWGPLPTAVNQTVGESAGVVRDGTFAMGIKPLNDRTEGAWPRDYLSYGWQNEVIANPYSLQVDVLEEWSSAVKTSWGSLLRAFKFDYTKERARKNRGGSPIPVGPLTADATVVGSKIALYGSAPALAPTIMSNIASGEGLPYPTQNGQWQKTAQASSQSFLVYSDMSTTNVEKGADFANLAGVGNIYSLPNAVGPWQTTGHYQFSSQFGGSDANAKLLVDKAEAKGVHIGVHTISDFISSDDSYVRPTPDSRLAAAGRAKLTRPLAAADTTLWLDGSATVVNGINGKTLRIGNEFITYTGNTQVGAEWQVTGLARAQWGSTATAAATGATASRIVIQQYGGPIGGLGIIDEISTRFGTIWNTTGIRANSFDGLEAASEGGWGSYGLARLVNGSYAKTTNKDGHVTETSRMTANTWDALTRASWGEVGFTSWNQVFLNNTYYQANYLPGMLGWIRLGGSDTLLSLENKMARGAGLNGGSGFQTSISSLTNGGTNALALLEAMKQWEAARNLGAFTEAQKVLFRDQSTNWHLSVVVAGKTWSLQQLDASGNNIGTAQTVTVATPSLVTSSLPAAVRGTLYEAKIVSSTPATIRWSVTSGALPAGLQLNKDTGGVIGVPTTTGQFDFTVTATNTSGQSNAQKAYRVTVS